MIGQGGMGAVYEALNLRTHRRVAIKTLLPAYCADAQVLARLWREAQAASQIRHPHIVDVLDLGVDAATGEHFIVQELLEGRSFEAMLEERLPGAMAPDEALEIVVPVMGALVACHRQGIVHRDIKPANVFVSTAADGRRIPKVIDFGISKFSDVSARQTATGMVLGTPTHMSPEQARGDADVDARADVWSVGVMLYEALSGRLPYEGANANIVIAKILTSRPVPFSQVAVGVSPQLVAAVERAVEPDRALRWPSMQAFVGALLECDLSPSVRATLRDAAPPSQAPPEPSFSQVSSPSTTPRATDVGWGARITGGATRSQVSIRGVSVVVAMLLAIGLGIVIGGRRSAANGGDSASHAILDAGVSGSTATRGMLDASAAQPATPQATTIAAPSADASPRHPHPIAPASAGAVRRPASPRVVPPSGTSRHGRPDTAIDPLAPPDPYARVHSP